MGKRLLKSLSAPDVPNRHESDRKQLGKDMACIPEHYASKVPEVTLGFWIIKILATTLGETGGDTVTMTMDLGYLTVDCDFPVGFGSAGSHPDCCEGFTPSSTGP